jgi:LTXXQ motif family protein
MKQFVTLSIAALVLAIGVAVAQTPYAGMQTRSIKALSDQQIADLRAGRGMGLALAAELNGYPGPAHVLEMADKLDISSDQRTSIQRLFDAMKAEVLPLGSKLIEQEADLDKQFAGHTVTPESLKASTAAIAVTQGELRDTHLKYHLATVALLLPDQMKRYAELRGYGDQGLPHHHH